MLIALRENRSNFRKQSVKAKIRVIQCGMAFPHPQYFQKKCIFKKFYILIIEVINIAQMRILVFDYKVNKIGEIK